MKSGLVTDSHRITNYERSPDTRPNTINNVSLNYGYCEVPIAEIRNFLVLDMLNTISSNYTLAMRYSTRTIRLNVRVTVLGLSAVISNKKPPPFG